MKRFAIVTTALSRRSRSGMHFHRRQRECCRGTITGTVKYDGTAPAPKTVEVTKDKEVCGLKPHFNEDLIVGSDGGIANAWCMSRAPRATEAGDRGVRSEGLPTTMPHVLAFPAGSTVKIMNDDGILHNIHTYSTAIRRLTSAQPKFKKEMDKVRSRSPKSIKVTCDAHGWMHGWWVAADTPYYAVTDDKGNYTIKDVPPATILSTYGRRSSARRIRRLT